MGRVNPKRGQERIKKKKKKKEHVLAVLLQSCEGAEARLAVGRPELSVGFVT